MAHSYDVGTRAWQPDPQEGWISSEVEDRKVKGGRVTLRFVLANGEVEYHRQPLKDSTDHCDVQTKSVETTEAALQDGSDSSLPPLMNPTILEASEDLTNLSHLNEPAGNYQAPSFTEADADLFRSPASNQITIFPKRDLYIFRNRPDSHEPVRTSRFIIRTPDGASVCRKAACLPSTSSIRHC
jgi:hypothetical protein